MGASSAFDADYQALVDGSGAVELKGWTSVRMTGADRQTFLHNMCTNDIKGLQVGDCCEAFCTDVKGKIVAHAFVFAYKDSLELLTVPGQAETIIGHLDRYIIREEVVLTDTSNATKYRYTGGSNAFHDSIELDESDDGACCLEAWEARRIEMSLPLLGVDFDNSQLPQEIDRDKLAINFNKGCYLGQETIARIDALGHVNQKVVLVKFSGKELPTLGLELRAGEKIVGKITSCAWSPAFNSPIALAMVRRGSNDLGCTLDSELGVAIVTPPANGSTNH